MEFRRLVVPILVFVIFVGGAFAAYQVSDLSQKNAAREPKTVTNESISQQVGIYQLVSKSTDEFTAGFNDTVTVYNNSSHELTQGTDYEWNATDGSIKFLNTASTNDGEPATITYTYYENTQGVKDLAGPLGALTEFIGKSGFMMAGFAFVLFLMAFAGWLAKRFTNSGPSSNR